MNRALSVICLMMAQVQPRVFPVSRQLMQKADEESHCVTYSLLSLQKAEGKHTLLEKVWGVKIEPKRQLASTETQCLTEAFAVQMPELDKLGYTPEVTSAAEVYKLKDSVPKNVVVWFHGLTMPPTSKKPCEKIQRVYLLKGNKELSIFGPPLGSLENPEIRLVKHSLGESYGVHVESLQKVLQHAVGNFKLDLKVIEKMVENLKEITYQEVSYTSAKKAVDLKAKKDEDNDMPDENTLLEFAEGEQKNQASYPKKKSD